MKIRLMCTSEQRQYLNALLFDDEVDVVLYGGSRGPGKTHIDVLAQVLRRLMHAKTQGMITRKTQKAADQTLKTVFDRIHFSPPPVGLGLPIGAVKFNVADRTFTYPNGSVQSLAYCNKEADYEQFMSGEFADQAWEELTQHKKKAWDMVSGSNRTNVPSCKAKRSANANPGGQGMAWVKEDIINSENPRVLFIPALPASNMALLENDPGYIDRVLSGLPDWQRRQWRDGDWDAEAGQYFHFNREQVRKLPVPYYAPWYGGVDWGRAKPFACLLIACWQEPYSWPAVHHIHVRAEIYKCNLELDEQAQQVNQRESDLRELGELNAEKVIYYADPAVNKLLEGEREEQGRTVRSTWAKHKFFVIPSRSNVRVAGWELLKMLMKHGILTIDPSCKGLLSEILGAIYEGTENGGEPTGEDISESCPDHCFIAGTLVTTARGDIPIEQIREGDAVLTRDGLRPVVGCGLTQENAAVFELLLSNGKKLVGTGNHPIFVPGKGFVRLDSIGYNEVLYSIEKYQEESAWQSRNSSSGTEFGSTVILTVPIGQTDGISNQEERRLKKVLAHCIKRFGKQPMDPSRQAASYITKTRTHLIMNSRIWSASRTKNTPPDTRARSVVSGRENTSSEFARLPLRGMDLMQVGSGTVNTEKTVGRVKRSKNILAKSAARSSYLSNAGSCVSVLTPVNPSSGDVPGWITKLGFASFVDSLSRLQNTSKQNAAPVSVVACRAVGRAEVYNLTVAGTPEYFANGVLVHNCLDALRYFCLSKFGTQFKTDQKNPYTGKLLAENQADIDKLAPLVIKLEKERDFAELSV
jgi:hypothetical protein